jgi:hypothetical protein
MTNKESVTISAGAINSVPYLSYLIKAALQENRKEKSAEIHEHYRGQFSLVVGLSLTALMERGGKKEACRKYFNDFLSCSDDFTRCPDEFDQVSLLVAEVVCSAMSVFGFIGSPRYFDDFIQAVISVVYPESKESLKKKGKIDELLKKLFETFK